MDAMNYLSPVSSIESIKSENIASLFDDLHECFDLTKCLDANDLRELKQYFFPNENVNSQKTRSQSFDYEGISLTKEGFADAIQQIFGKENIKLSALRFFEDLQRRNVINESISWHHVVDTIIEQFKKQKFDAPPTETCPILQFKTKCFLSHSKGSIIQIIALETVNSFCYLVASICGKVGIYDENMFLCDVYDLSSFNFRRKNNWISSVSHAASGHSIFFSLFDRSLYIYNTSRLQHRLKFVISELPNVVTCMKFRQLRTNGKLLMLLGDDLGNIYCLIFHQHLKSYFEEQPNTEVGRYFWSEVKNQAKWVTIQCFNRVHNEFVMNVEYVPKKNMIISFSKDPAASIVITHQGEKKVIKTCKLRKGLVCMAYDEKFGYLATSSSDKFITLWNSNNPVQYITNLHGHEANVTDVRFMANAESLLSISNDGVLKLWNTETFKCLQNVELEFIPPSKSYLGCKVIFERLISETGDTNDKDKPPMVFEVLIASENTITTFSVKGCQVSLKKKLPLKDLETKVPSPEMIFKHYNRENPLSFRELKQIELKEGSPKEDNRDDMKQFIKQGAVYLGLKVVTVDDNATSIQ